METRTGRGTYKAPTSGPDAITMKNIIYNRQKCIGCGKCAAGYNALFYIDSIDGKANLSDGYLKKDQYFRTLWPDEQPFAKSLAAVCPVKAIILS